MFTKTDWQIEQNLQLEKNKWYLLLANHQSWVDIMVLQRVFYGKIPFIKFFLKQELIWFPLLGLAWWALDYPFMKRYPKHILEKNPHLRGKDLEKTKEACLKFSNNPVTIMNFPEGTRFTKEKQNKSGSSFKHLLKPKAGGIANVLTSMYEKLDCIIDVTIIYPDNKMGFLDFISGGISQINVIINEIKISKEMTGDYQNDENYKKQFQEWLNNIWKQKDQLISKELS